MVRQGYTSSPCHRNRDGIRRLQRLESIPNGVLEGVLFSPLAEEMEDTVVELMKGGEIGTVRECRFVKLDGGLDWICWLGRQ
jgi:hypothetical protein